MQVSEKSSTFDTVRNNNTAMTKTIKRIDLVRMAIAYADSLASDPFAPEWMDAYDEWMAKHRNEYNVI